MGHSVVHLKIITGLNERTSAAQKATVVGKITQIYNTKIKSIIIF